MTEPAPSPAELRDAVDHVAVCRLQDAYADTVTRRAWAGLADLFLPTCTLHLDTVTSPPRGLTGPAAVGEFIGGAVERFSFFEFVVLTRTVDLRVDGDPDRATGRIFMCELRQDADGGRRTTAYGVYRDTYARVDDRWWFAERHYRSLARTAGPDDPHDLDVLPWPENL